MSQTSIIAASLIIAFLVFVTVRGELPGYLSVFTGTGKAPATGAGNGSSVAGAVSNLVGGSSAVANDSAFNNDPGGSRFNWGELTGGGGNGLFGGGPSGGAGDIGTSHPPMLPL